MARTGEELQGQSAINDAEGGAINEFLQTTSSDTSSDATSAPDHPCDPICMGTVGVHTLTDLVRGAEGHIVIACDTEFAGPHTLTIQFAARLGDSIVVQVYHSPAIPAPSKEAILAVLHKAGAEAVGGHTLLRDSRPIPLTCRRLWYSATCSISPLSRWAGPPSWRWTTHPAATGRAAS